MSVRAKRGTRAAVNAAAAANGLKEGELIYITDEGKFAGATGVGAYGDISGGPRCIYRANINANGTVASSSGVSVTVGRSTTGYYTLQHGLGPDVIAVVSPRGTTTRLVVGTDNTAGGITGVFSYGYNNATTTDAAFHVALFL